MQSAATLTPTQIIRMPDKVDSRMEEFEDIMELLMDHALHANDATHELAMFIAHTACTGANHLWQDMGLPNRAALSMLMQDNFPALVAKNIGDMKWKKFFYRQLCERAEILICKSPSCGICIDYHQCFDKEE